MAGAARAAPECLIGQNHDEGILAAVVLSLKAERDRMRAKYSGRPSGLSVLDSMRDDANHNSEDGADMTVYLGPAFGLWLGHKYGNVFEVEVKFGDPGDWTAINPGDDDKTIAALIDGDVTAVRKMLSYTTRDRIWEYQPIEDEELRRVQGPPTFDLGIFVNGIGVQVWPDAAAFTFLDDVGNYRDRYLFLINKLASYGSRPHSGC
jgi:hypothetical protein